MLLPSHPATTKMVQLGPSVAQETRPNADSSFAVCVDQEQKSEDQKGKGQNRAPSRRLLRKRGKTAGLSSVVNIIN